ncbi:MAG: homocysteine S-methyltransferase family protein [Longibaculum sp.]
MEGLGVDALGVNCSLGPNELKPIIDEILEVSSLPVMIQPNAGLPCLHNGQTCYNDK